MPGASRLVRRILILSLAGSLAGGLGCAATTRVALDDEADFAAFRTWDWHGRVAHLVDGQHGGGPDLDGLLSRLIHRSLADRGYVRSRGSPDFFVTYDFQVRQRTRIELIQRAPYLLSSMHSSPSYWIEGAERRERKVQDLRLSVAVFEPSGQIVWKGVLRHEIDGYRRPELAGAVEGVLARFPDAPVRRPGILADTAN